MQKVLSTLMFSYENETALVEELRKLILEGVRKLKKEEWYIGKVTIDGEVKEYPHTQEGIAQSQADWNSVIEKTIHGFEAVDVYAVGGLEQYDPYRQVDIVTMLRELSDDNDSSLVRDFGEHERGYLAVITDDLNNTMEYLNRFAPLLEEKGIRIHENSAAAKCDYCGKIFDIDDLELAQGDLYCKECLKTIRCSVDI